MCECWQDLTSGQSIIFMPRLPESYAVWMGSLLTPQDFKVHQRAPGRTSSQGYERRGRPFLPCPASPAPRPAADKAAGGSLCWLLGWGAQAKYEVDQVHYVDELEAVLAALGGDGAVRPTLLLLQGLNTDSGKHTAPAAFKVACRVELPGLSTSSSTSRGTSRSGAHTLEAAAWPAMPL